MNREIVETKFTPGPWRLDNGIDGVWRIEDSHGWSICETAGGCGAKNLPGEDESDANAHLIAAAPALYEAIRRFVNACDTHRPAWLGNSEARRGFDELRAALALVDGQQETK